MSGRVRRVGGVALVTAVAVVVGWNAPYGVPVAALLAAAAWYTIVRLLLAGGLRSPRRSSRGRRDRAVDVRRAQVLGALVVVGMLATAAVTYAVPADARARQRPPATSCGLPYVPGRHCVPPVRPSYAPTPVVGAPSPNVTRGTIHVPTATSTAAP